MQQISDGITLGILLQRGFVYLCGVALEDNLSAQTSGIGTDVDQIVGSSHDLFVVLHHDHCVA